MPPAEQLERVRSCLQEQGYRRERQERLFEQYYRPKRRGDGWEQGTRVVKLSQDLANDTVAGLVYGDLDHQEHAGEAGPWLATTTKFLYPSGPILDTPERIGHLLDRLDFEPFLGVGWTLETWESSAPVGHAPALLTLGWGEQGLTLKIRAEAEAVASTMALLETAQVHGIAITAPLALWLQARLATSGGLTAL